MYFRKLLLIIILKSIMYILYASHDYVHSTVLTDSAMKVGFLLVCAAVLLAPVLVGARHIAQNERVPEKRQLQLIPLFVDLFADLGTSALGGALGSAVVGAGVGAAAAGTAHEILTHVGAQAVQKQPEPSTTTEEILTLTFPTTTPRILSIQSIVIILIVCFHISDYNKCDSVCTSSCL